MLRLILILLIVLNTLNAKIIEFKKYNISIEFSDKLYEGEYGVLWKKAILTNDITHKRIILSDNNVPVFSDVFEFSPDGQFLKYAVFFPPSLDMLDFTTVDCEVVDLYKNRKFFDEPALSRCRSDWYKKEPHTLVNGQDVGYDKNGKAYLKYFYRLPKESFAFDYRRIQNDCKKQNYLYLKERFTQEVIKRYLKEVPLDSHTVADYNNIAYYLEKAKAYKESVYLLEQIIKKYPNRTVAFYNLGDAYWELGNKIKAKEAYKRYIELMKKAGKETRIPQKVKDRV